MCSVEACWGPITPKCLITTVSAFSQVPIYFCHGYQFVSDTLENIKYSEDTFLHVRVKKGQVKRKTSPYS